MKNIYFISIFFLLVACHSKKEKINPLNSIPQINGLAIYSQDVNNNRWIYNHRGDVKSMNIVVNEYYEKDSESTIINVWFDKHKRIIKESNSREKNLLEYLYPNEQFTLPVVTAFYDGKILKYYDYKTYTDEGKPLIDCRVPADTNYYDDIIFYDYHKNGYEKNSFTDSVQFYDIDSVNYYIPETANTVQADIDALKPADMKESLDSVYNTKNVDYLGIVLKKGITRSRYADSLNTWIEAAFHSNDNGENVEDNWYYYSNGLLMKKIPMRGKYDLEDYGTIYKYNQYGQILSAIFGNLNNPKATDFYDEESYTYDSLNNLTEKKHFRIKGLEDKFTYEYICDQQGNWTMMKCYTSGKLSRTIRRKIEYYQKNDTPVQTIINASIIAQLKAISEKQIAACRNSYKVFKEKQSAQKNDIKDCSNLVSKNWKDFINTNWQIDSVTTGDLNNDGITDLVFASEPIKINNNLKNDRREIKILFKDSAGNYRMIAQSDKALFNESDNQVYFSGFEISNDTLIVNQDFIRGGSQQKYKFIDGNICLIEAARSDGDASYYSTANYNFLTGRYIYTYEKDGNDEDESKVYSNNKDTIIPPKTLIKIKDYEAISFEIEDQML